MSGADVFEQSEEGKAYLARWGSMGAEVYPRGEGRAYVEMREYAKDYTERCRVNALHTCDVSAERKATPVFSGVLAYFPLALMEIAKLSKIGNDKHNPGLPLQWSKGKSNDHADCIVRHLLEQGTPDPDSGLSHTVAVAWRALALLQTELEEAL